MEFSISSYQWPAFGGRKPFEHQIVTTGFLIRNKRGYVFNEQGTGKTLSALWAADILLSAGKIKRVLVVSPLSSLKSVWIREIMMNMPHRKAIVAHGNAQIRTNAIYDLRYEIVIINHDGVRYAEKELLKANFDLLIIDELTAFKTHDAERSRSMERVAKNVRAVWGLTGNLTPNSPIEAFFPCRIVNPNNEYLPRYFSQFRAATMQQINEYVWIPKPEAPKAVALCASPAIRFTRDECLDLPDTSFVHVEVPMSGVQAKYYEEMRKQAYIEMETGDISAVNAGVKLNKLLQISAGSVKSDDGEPIDVGCPERLAQLIELFEETPQRKLVVFATYRSTIAMLERELTKARINVDSIHGDVSQNRRAAIIERFQTGDLSVIVLQPQAAAHSITLTAASTIVWFSLIPSNELFEQGNARIVRAGQTRKTFIYMLISSGADRHMANILERKDNMSQAVLKMFSDRQL